MRGSAIAGLVLAVGTAGIVPVLTPSSASAAPVATAAAKPDPVTERPDRVSALLAAQAQGSRVEITNDRTETSTTWANPDGTLTTDSAVNPIRVQKAPGEWVPVDYDLVPTDGGFAPKASPVRVEFSGGGSGPAATLAKGSRQLGLDWASALPKPTIDGATATYAVSPSINLVLTATDQGFEESLIFTERPSVIDLAHLPLTADLALKGLSAADSTQADGGIDFTRESGAKVFRASAPVIYDAGRDAEGLPTHQIQLSSSLSSGPSGPRLDLSGALKFLADPATVYPVTVDPVITSVSRSGDTWFAQNDTTSHLYDTELWVGYNGSIIRRAIAWFGTGSWLNGAHVTSASLKLWNNVAFTCTPKTVYAYPVTSSWPWSVVWSNQPSINTSTAYRGTATFSHGDEADGCGNDYGSIDVTNLVGGWASGAYANYGIELRAPETDALARKEFCSMNPDTTGSSCTGSARFPTLSVTYNSYPSTATGLAWSPAVTGTDNLPYALSLTPTLSAKAANADGAKVKLWFNVTHDPADASTTDTTDWTGSVAGISPNAIGSVQIPAGTLSLGGHYHFRVRASVTNGAGGTDYGAWSAWVPFVLNTVLPDAPQVTCPSYPAGQWSTQASGSVSCTFDTDSGDGTAYLWSLDDPDARNVVATSGGRPQTVTITPGPGQHTLYAMTRDSAYHPSPTTTAYTFGVGPGGLLTPAAGARTQASVDLTAQSSGDYQQVTYQYRAGVDSSLPWTTVPPADVHAPGSSSAISWPQAGAAGTSVEDYSELDWNLADTIHAAGGGDGPVQVRACFDAALSVCSNVDTVTLASTSFADSAATQDLGPGTVSLNTGDFELSASDASEAGMSVGRTATSLRMRTGSNNTVSTTSPAGIFGPGWVAELPGSDAGAADETLADNSAAGYLTLTGSDGSTLIYRQTSGSGASATYAGIGDANDGSTLKCGTLSGSACTSWTLTDTDGTKTTWSRPSTSSSIWTVAQVVTSGDAATNTTSFTHDATGRLTRILAPVPSGVTCGAGTSGLNPGCQALSLTYAGATTATGTDSAGWGDYAGLVSGVSYTAYDPATSAMKTTQVAAYAYDNTGHLRASWDPRISPALKTTYDYDSTGRVTALTPPGLATWTMAYDDSGRLASVSQPDPANGTATQDVVYQLKPDGSNGPDLSGTATSTWGQSTDLPDTGAAVFPASHPLGSPDSHGDYAASDSDLTYGDLSFVDVNGRVVDTASYGAGGWQIDSTRYDSDGNTVWSLSALNRNRALHPDADTDPLVANDPSSAERANMLATVATYSTDGVDLLTTTGPTHQAQLASGATASIRTTTTNSYCDGAPEGNNQCHLVTSSTVAAVPLDNTPTTAADSHTTLTGYDPIASGDPSGWDLHAPTSQTTIMGSNANAAADLVNVTRYNTDGQVIETRLPGSAGSDAGATVTSYYTTAGSGSCGGKPQWAGLPCQTGPAAQPAGTTIPTTVTTYDYYLNPVATTDTSGTSTRTTTTTYDAGERPVTTTITASPAADAGATVPAVTTSYDPDTGLPTGTTTGSGTSAVAITQTFNSLGEQTSYTDADGNTTTSTYDIDGNLHTVNDGKGTYTYTYDGTDAAGNSEHRGLLTKVDTGMTSAAADFAGSTFTAAYDADGNMVREDYPNGLSATWTYDDTGAARALTYATGGDTWLSYAASQNGFGETVAQSSPSSSQKFGYDNAGRLVTTVDDAIDDQGGQACVTRAYTFNKDSDRTSLTTSTPAPENTDGTCPAASSNAIVSDTFDTADRITTNGAYKYDPFGRTRIVPASGLANSGVTTGADPGGDLGVGYYANDMVASQTQGAVSKTFSLDPAMRLRSATDTTTTVPGSSQETRRTLNHYSDGSDSPAWIATSTDAGSTWTWERNVIGIDGNLAALQESDAASVPQLQLTNLHGDIVATVDDTTDAIAPSSTTESTEYGIPRDPNAGEARYGWVGGQRRSADDLAGLVLMGVRLYNPATGRFLSVDPVAGGSANPYAYPTDPVDNSDLSGMFWGGMIRSAVKIAFQVVQYSPGNVGTIANLAKMAADVHGAIKSGNWNKVALDGVDLVAGYVGGKLASRIADKVATTYGEKMAAKKGRHLIKHHGKTTWSQRRVKESVEAMGSTMSTQFAHYIEISSQARVDKASHLYARKGGH